MDFEPTGSDSGAAGAQSIWICSILTSIASPNQLERVGRLVTRLRSRVIEMCRARPLAENELAFTTLLTPISEDSLAVKLPAVRGKFRFIETLDVVKWGVGTESRT
jgi:hypothetical protein